MADESENVLDLAVKKRQALAEELRRLDNFISTYKSLRAEQPAREIVGGIPVTSMPKFPDVGDSAPQLPLGKSMTQETGAIALVEKRGPMTLKEILNSLRESGVPVGGKDPLANLSSVLSRSERMFYDKESGTWNVKQRFRHNRLLSTSESKEGDDE
jgi:hypothetical protein